MNSDSHDDELGSHLDAYLTSLERGQPRPESPASSNEAPFLERVVEELHSLAQFLTNPPQSNRAGSQVPPRIGKYRIRQLLGSGGQSTAFLAHDPDLDRIVVIKRYHDAATDEQRRRLLTEARALARIASPHVARCFGADTEEGLPFLVLEHVPGKSLAQIDTAELTTQRVAQIVRDVALGLRDVHARGLVHRDVKPANIVIGDDGKARVVDFGMAHIIATPANSSSGTPAYMSPEQARGEADRIDVRTDIFGLGAVLFELLTGRAPFGRPTRDESLRAAREGVVEFPRVPLPAGLAQICLRCLAAEKLNRYATIDEFLSAVDRWRLKRRAIWLLPAAALLLLLIVAAVRPSRRGPPQVRPAAQKVHRATAFQSATLAVSQLPADVVQVFALDGQLRQDFGVNVQIQGASLSDDKVMHLQAGDQIKIQVVSERDCYVTVLSCGVEPPVQIFPSPPYDDVEDARVLAFQPTVLPRETAPRYAAITATPSRGKEALCIVASTRPISLAGEEGGSRLVFRTAQQRDQLAMRIRGLIREPQPAGQAVSQIVIPYWVDSAAPTPAVLEDK